jgi:hypothetical protein
MFTNLSISITKELLDRAVNSIPQIDFRFALNRPTGNFFYDPWVINDDLKDSVWQEILQSIPEPIGEARLIKLDPGSCYRSHSDIDDRWHLSLISEKSFIIDLDTNQMFPLEVDLKWHFLNAGPRHSAVNFGHTPRIQLVVRSLLNRGTNIVSPISITIVPKSENISNRFYFDDTVSPLLNLYTKQGLIDDFDPADHRVKLTIEKSKLQEFKSSINNFFDVIV